ncbi:unnamed protein product [Sympodiomycopsis kandeliae]
MAQRTIRRRIVANTTLQGHNRSNTSQGSNAVVTRSQETHTVSTPSPQLSALANPSTSSPSGNSKSLVSGRSGMNWRGCLTEDEVKKLNVEFGDEVVCPGYTARFGNADGWGRVYIPGAAMGYGQARRKLLGWKDKNLKDEKFNWWPRKANEELIELIRVSDILRGLDTDKWEAYRKRYKKFVVDRVQERAKNRRQEQAQHNHDADTPTQAAAALAALHDQL